MTYFLYMVAYFGMEDYSMETCATSKGQIVIPAKLRRKFGFKAGTRIHVSEECSRIVLQPITR